MRNSVSAKVGLVVLVLAVGFMVVSGHVRQVYALDDHHEHEGDDHDFFFNHFFFVYPYYYYPYSMGSYGSCSSNQSGTTYGGYGMGGYGGYSSPYSYGSSSSCWSSQYKLTVNSDPSSLSGQVTGAGTYGSGSSASFSAGQSVIQVSQDTRYVFSHWTGDYSGSGTSGTVTMDASKTITAVYQLQYYVSLTAQPSNAPSPQGGGWYNVGDTATLTIPSQTGGGSDGSRLVFNGWSVDGGAPQPGSTLSLQMSGPHTVNAQYEQQYYLTVSSSQGVASGQGWYDAGSYAQISVTTPPSPSYGVNLVFNGWQGDAQSTSQSTQVLMDSAKSVTATWRTDYTVLYVTLAAILAIIALATWATIHTAKSRRHPTPTTQNNSSVKA